MTSVPKFCFPCDNPTATASSWWRGNCGLHSCQYRVCCEAGADPSLHHECGYVNEYCPASCSTEHSIGDFEATCLETGELFSRCSCCGWVELRRYETMAEHQGDLYCPSCAGDLYACECGDMFWADDGFRSEGELYCSRECSRAAGSVPPIPLVLCQQCGTRNDHFSELDEVFLCDCAACNHLHRKLPVILARPIERTLMPI